MPIELIRKVLEQNHRYRAHQLRKMLAVSYAEKALYEMSDDELTPENILSMLRETEQRMLFQSAGGRPILSIPHLISGESSAYYHGYILAQMAVFQTRDYFIQRDGYIMDNPNVGDELAESYWRPGNSKTFLEVVEDLTGQPFSARATVDLVNKSLETVFAEADRAIEREQTIPHPNGPVELDATITIINGDEVVADTRSGTFQELSERFADWIQEQEPA
jgi:Zn-dependent oligopeptidase